MRPAKVRPDDDIDFLIATPKVCSATEAARVQPDTPDPPAHDAFTPLLTRLEPDPLWAEAEPQVERSDGVLVVDDSTLDKPSATAIERVTRHGSGQHRAVVQGIHLVSRLWTDGDRHIPCDYRVDHTADGRTKNDHFADRIRTAPIRGFRPRCVLVEGGYSRLANLKLVRACGWVWRTRRKSNRLVNRNREGTHALKDPGIAATGTEVWLPG